MKEKLNKIVVVFNYVLVVFGIVFLVLAFNFHDMHIYKDIYLNITIALFVLIPISIILAVVYFLKNRN